MFTHEVNPVIVGYNRFKTRYRFRKAEASILQDDCWYMNNKNTDLVSAHTQNGQLVDIYIL